MNVRAPLLVAICLSVLSAAQADEARTFQASIDVLTGSQRDKMNGQSWREVCPVPLDDLVSIHLNYVGFDDAAHDGVLVVHRKLAKETIEIFGELFAAGFPIERMQPYEDSRSENMRRTMTPLDSIVVQPKTIQRFSARTPMAYRSTSTR
jgi:hypothetical protein